MGNSKHIINRVLFEVNTADTKTAYYLKDHLDVFLKDSLLPTITSYFNSVQTFGDQILRFDTLRLDIDCANVKDQVQLQLDVVRAFQKKLGNMDDKAFLDTKDAPFLRTTKEKSDVDAFFHFLKTGRNPWWDSEKKLEDPLFINTLISRKNFKKELLEKIGNSNIRKRLIYQFSDEVLISIFSNRKNNISFPKTLTNQDKREQFWDSIIRFQRHKNKEILHEEFNKLDHFGTKKTIQKEVAHFFKERLRLKDLINKDLLPEEIKLSELQSVIAKAFTKQIKLALEANKVFKISSKNIEKHIDDKFKKNINNKVLKKLIVQFTKELSTFVKEKQAGSRKAMQSFVEELLDEQLAIEVDNNLQNIDTVKDQIFQYTEEEIDEIEDVAIYIHNAGLILLHPYLKILFGALGLLDKVGTIVPEKVELAIHLLHYLATKEEEPMETDLTLEKFLCGYPLDKPIRKHIKLSKSFKEESEKLLNSVIQNWQVLKNTSADGLRENFIKRDGKLLLEQESGKHRIIIERKTQDLLLEKLPWNLNMIKLPWFDQLIFVEW
ncbi:contractile injection system tape measure protein [Aquimarina sp. 433]